MEKELCVSLEPSLTLSIVKAKRFKVLVFSSLYPNNVWHNHGVFIKERMTEVGKYHGCEIVVIAPVPYYPRIKVGWRSKYAHVVDREWIEGIEVFHPRYIMLPKIGMLLHGFLMCLSVWPTVRKLERRFGFDLIDSHYVYPDGFAAILLGRLLRKPVIVSARGSDINLFVRFAIIRRLLKYTLRRAGHVVAVSDALKSAIVQLGIPVKKVTVIPNGVDERKFRRIDKMKSRHSLRLPLDRPIILSVGGLTPVKGFDLLIQSFGLLCARSGRIKPYLVIVGEGRLRERLQEFASALGLDADITFVGSVAHEELYIWYSAADVFCLASEREGWPNVVLEALACGTPVVAAAVGGIPEVIINDDVGLLTTREPEVMASRIWQAIHKTWNAEAIANYAKTFTWNQVGVQVRSIYEAVANCANPALS